MSFGKLTQAIKQVIAAQKNISVLQENLEDKQENTAGLFQDQNVEIGETKYLDLFIEITEHCLNNTNRSATLCTDLIMHISNVISDPSSWKKHFNSTIQWEKNQIHEKINQFLSNSVLIIENQKPVQSIMIMALTNMASIDEPDEETLCEMCLRTLKDLYLNNMELRRMLKDAVRKNIIINLEQNDVMSVSLFLLNGLIDFGKEIDIGSWFSERQCQIMGRWMEQIFDLFSRQSLDNDKNQKIEAALQLMCQGFKDEQFAVLIQTSINMPGVLRVLNHCFQNEAKGSQVKTTASIIYQKNKIIYFMIEMVSSINGFLKKNVDKESKDKYTILINNELKSMVDELLASKLNFGFSKYVDSAEQCQIMNKKFGSLVKALAKILINDDYTSLKEKRYAIFEKVMSLIKEKKIDPYIYGSLCQLAITIMRSKICRNVESEEYPNAQHISDENLHYLFTSCDGFTPSLLMLTRQAYVDLLTMSRVYAQNIYIPAEFSLSYLPTRELQYAILQIISLLNTVYDQANDASHIFKGEFVKKITNLENQNLKSILLGCLEAPIEEIRVQTCKLLTHIDAKKWEFDDLNLMHRILEKLTTFLQDSYGEEEISTLMMIFCKLFSLKSSQVANNFKASPSAAMLCAVTYRILKINMSRDTSEDEEQTRQKLELAAACVYMLKQYSYNQKQRLLLFTNEALIHFSESLQLEDSILQDSSVPLGIEELCLVIQPLLICLEATQGAVSPFHINFFRALMQINRILNKVAYYAAAKEEQYILQAVLKAEKFKGFQEEVDLQFESSADILASNKEQLIKLCHEQWHQWVNNEEDLHLEDAYQKADDLTSAFEVQHTIFSAQNGVDRLLICLQPIVDLAKFDLEERHFEENNFFEAATQGKTDKPRYKKVLIAGFSKHALFSKLIGFDIQPRNEVIQYQSQFFETVQRKKTMANSMIDITKLSQESFYQFITTPQSQICKIALVTSALFYSCLISINYAPSSEVQNNALQEIQQQDKLIQFIKLCSVSEWYNACVSLKLLKIYRLIVKFVLGTFNFNNRTEANTKNHDFAVQEAKVLDDENPQKIKRLEWLKKDLHEFHEKNKARKAQLYHTQLSGTDMLENCYLINRMIQIIISDFKEILECLDEGQLKVQLKLINAIFKTIICIFKQIVFISTKAINVQSLEQYLFPHIRLCAERIEIPIFFEELTICLSKLDKKAKFENDVTSYKLLMNLSQVLAIFYMQRNDSLNEMFGNLCKKFTSQRLSEAVNQSIKDWVIWMILLKMYQQAVIPLQLYYKQIPVFHCHMDYKKIDSFSFTENVYLVLYPALIMIFEPQQIEVNQEFLETKLMPRNFKIHQMIYPPDIKFLDKAEEVLQDDEEDDAQRHYLLEMTLHTESTFQFRFKNQYLQKKVSKYLTQYQDVGTDNTII